MKQLIASVAAVGLIASPALAASSTPAKASSAKATTTMTTKTTPVAAKGKAHGKVKHHRSHSKSAMAHAAHKPAPKSKSSDTTKKN